MRLIELPFAYIFRTRLKNYRSLIGYVAREWVPLIITLQVAYSAQWWLCSAMFIGFLSLYECGYLVNDLLDLGDEPGGNRIERLQIRLLPFWFSHLFVFASVTGMLFLIRGARFGLNFAGLGAMVFGVLLIHSVRSVRSVPFLRIFTFTILAVYKFAPVVVPQVPLADGQTLLMAVFLCYGFPRAMFYAIRKLGNSESRTAVERSFVFFECAALIVFGPILVTVRWETPRETAISLIWVLYCATAALFLGLNLLRLRFSKHAEQPF